MGGAAGLILVISSFSSWSVVPEADVPLVSPLALLNVDKMRLKALHHSGQLVNFRVERIGTALLDFRSSFGLRGW